MMSVINKSFQGTKKFGVQDPDRWSQEAMDFVSMTVDDTHEELISHPFVSLVKGKSISWLVTYVLRKARIIVGTLGPGLDSEMNFQRPGRGAGSDLLVKSVNQPEAWD